MTKDQLHSILDKMIQNPKSKNFINHLVRAYTPISNVQLVTETPISDFKCTLTRKTLVSFSELLTIVNDKETSDKLLENMKQMFDEDAEKRIDMSELIGDKRLGVTGKQTTTFMSYSAFQIFYEWVMIKTLSGDKHINWLLNSIKRENFESKQPNQSKSSQTQKAKTATFKIGDANNALEIFKQKLINEGK